MERNEKENASGADRKAICAEQAEDVKAISRTSGEQHQPESSAVPISATWAQETIEDLDDFIESQGIYIRQ